MIIPSSRVSDALVSALVATACLVILVLTLAGPSHFLSVLWGSALHILGISVVAGVVRLPFRRGGFAVSAICGAIVAVAGFLVVLAAAVSNI
jgi:hypothetical protein